VNGLIPVGKKPSAIEINPKNHLAVVANEEDDSITVIDLKSWVSHVIPVGKHPLGVTINPLDNRALVICDEDRTLLLIDLETNSIIQTYFLNKLPRGVAVNNFTNIAAVTDDKTDSLTLIQLPNPVPQIEATTPNAILRGSKSTDITIEGSGFIKSSVVSFQGIASQALPAGFIDNHSFRAAIPEELLQKAGTYHISVTNPSPEGGESNSAILNINNPVPSIFMLEPTEAIAGTQGLTLTLYGTGIFDDTEVYFGDIKKQIVFINNAKLQIYLTPEDLKTSGQYEITARNSSPGGGISNELIFTIKNPLEIKITSPTDGEVINKAKIMVKGTVKSDTKDIGVKVNGTIADITGNEWVASNVPLTVGLNIITATATDSPGNTDTKAITINTDDTSQPVELSANITSGIAPLQSLFTASTSTFTPGSYQMDFEGDGFVDYTGSTFEDITHTYTTEGVFYPILSVIDEQGNIYSDTIAITVINKAEIDALLKSKWDGMKGALESKDTEEALKYFVDSSKEKYKIIFEALKEQLPSILSTFVEFNIAGVYENIAEYELVANENGVLYSYPGLFIRDAGGLWKFRDF
jgi:YVTN family beta-propeller protein